MSKCSSSKVSEKEAAMENQKCVDFNSVEDLSGSISYCSDLWYFLGDEDFSKYDELQFLAHADDLYLDILSPPLIQACDNGIGILSSVDKPRDSPRVPPNQDESYSFPSASLEILRQYTSRSGSVNGKKIQISKLSAGNFVPTDSAARNGLVAMSNPCESTFLALAGDHAEDVQLVRDLISCAEEVCNQQYDSARKLLEKRSKVSFGQMNTLQRLVYYFTEALCDKIERKIGEFAGERMVYKWPSESANVSSAVAAFFQKSPLNQAAQFTSIQSVVDHVSDSRKVHIVDLGIKCGIQQMIMMQALAERSDQCPLEHLKITAIATNPNLAADAARVRLEKLAESLNLSFSFHVIRLEEILDLQMSTLGLDPEETVVVHAAFALKSMIMKRNQLELLMTVIRSINPRLMIVNEVEADINSPAFVSRFLEALFYYGAYFDYLEDCLKNDVAERTLVESNLFGPVIRDIVAAEGEEGMFPAVGINVWRDFFDRFGMVETELSTLALDHANLILNRFENRDSCTLGPNGKCLIAGWKGTPICSLSAWKFNGTT